MRLMFLVATLLGAAFISSGGGRVVCGRDGQEGQPKRPWFEMEVHPEQGCPRFVHRPSHTRDQREVLLQLSGVHRLTDLDKIESELGGALSGMPKEGGYGYCESGVWAFDFYTDGRFKMWDEYDRDKKDGTHFPTPVPEYTIPLADFAEAFRAWAASVRYWRSIGGYQQPGPPREAWPKSYPPRRDA